MLVRLDSARARLNAHHSAPFRGMRRGGAGGGGTANAQAARQLLLSLLDGAIAGSGPQSRRGNGGGGGGSRPRIASRTRDGEWRCRCGFDTNRPHREACYICGQPRSIAEVRGPPGAKGSGKRWATGGKYSRDDRMCTTSGGLGKGPVGAGGSRPLLGGRGREQQDWATGGGHGKGFTTATAWGNKGATMANTDGKAGGLARPDNGNVGKGTTKGGSGGHGKATPIDEHEKGGNAWTRPKTVWDAEGYQLVQPRRVRTSQGGPTGGPRTAAAGAEEDGDGGAGITTTTRRRWSDDEDSDADCMDGDEVDDGEDGARDNADGTDAWNSDPGLLRATYEEHAKAARDLERRGIRGPALATLQAARDQAERKWRQAKPPAPLPKRLDWADGKLRKAQATLTRIRLELEAFDEETERKREEICRRIQVAEEWYHWRRKQVDDIHEEAAGKVMGRRDGAPKDDGSDEIRKRIRGQMLPEMQAIMEAVPEGSDLHGRLALFAAGLADAEARLGVRQEEGGPTQYHMGDGDDSLQGDWDDDFYDGHQDTADDDAHRGGGPGAGRHDERPAEWRPEGPGRWTRTRAPGENDRRTNPGEAAASGVRPPNGSGGPGVGAPAGGDAGKPGCSGGGSMATDAKGAAEGAPEGSDDARAGKHRRTQSEAEAREAERNASDAKRAQELRRQLEQATAAQEQSYRDGCGGFGSEAALSMAAQSFVLEVQKAQAQANEMGIEPRASDGRYLLQLSPAELRQWVQDNLDNDAMDQQ